MIKIYTDGACSGNPGPGGWAYIICKDESIVHKSGGSLRYTTNNRMELTAIIRALKEIITLENENYFQVISDSEYAINAINRYLGYWQSNGWKTAKGEELKNLDLWEEILNLKEKCRKQNKQIIFKKIKAHDGNYFNEWVDFMAKNEINNQVGGVRG